MVEPIKNKSPALSTEEYKKMRPQQDKQDERNILPLSTREMRLSLARHTHFFITNK